MPHLRSVFSCRHGQRGVDENPQRDFAGHIGKQPVTSERRGKKKKKKKKKKREGGVSKDGSDERDIVVSESSAVIVVAEDGVAAHQSEMELDELGM